ncbi:MAG: hypothetical protein WBW73_07500 [Rhodoplanes sp.]
MIEMTRPALVSVLGSEFDDFLFAPIGEDRNDTPVSVLSALARLDMDPWQEAAELAQLPGETATQRLVSLMAALPDGPLADRDLGTIAGSAQDCLCGTPARKVLPELFGRAGDKSGSVAMLDAYGRALNI